MAETHTTRDAPTPPVPIDTLDPRFYDSPWEAYRWLRQQPGFWFDATNDLWIASRHEDVSHVSRNDDLYSAAQGVRPKVAAPMSIIAMDDPEHTRQRRLINKGFTPRVVRELADHIRELSNQILDEVQAAGEIDFVEDFAMHVPLIVIAELMGLDPAKRRQLYEWSDLMMAGDGHLDPEDPVLLAAATAFGEFAAVATEVIEDRRATGNTDDVIGILTNAYDEGALASGGMADGVETFGGLGTDELLIFLALLIVAGNETTRNALSGGLVAFSRFPGEKQKLIDEPALIDAAVDEIVRYVSPVLSFSRTVTDDHTYEGTHLKAGDRVLMLYQSANRDEAVFDDPDVFRIDRDPNPHLGFGVGTHYCLGANLAKAEIKVVFEQLFSRLHDIRARDPHAPFDRGDSSLVMSIRHVPAVFMPRPSSSGPATTP